MENPSDFKIRTFYIDEQNALLIKSNNRLIIVRLKLKNMKPRMIGTVTKSTRTIEMKRKRDKHLHYMSNSYGFNDYILKEQTSFDWVRLSDDRQNHWKIPVSYILEKGKYLNFKQQGFELQRFVSLENLEQFRVKSEENRRL